MRAPAKIYMRKNSLLRKDAPACLPEKFANPNADSYAITGLQGITGITVLMAGTDIRTLAAILGHSTLQMVLRYTHLIDEHKLKAVDRINTLGLE